MQIKIHTILIRVVTAVVLLMIGALIGRALAEEASTNRVISSRQLRILLSRKKPASKANNSFALINVHIPYEGEIPQTDALIPFDKITANSGVLPDDKRTQIILYDKTGTESAQAIPALQKLGYHNIRTLRGGMDAWKKSGGTLFDLSVIPSQVTPADGVALPVSWGMLISRLVDIGVIDLPAFRDAVVLTPDQEQILTQGSTGAIRIDAKNSQFVVDVLWALGLAQKSIVYDEGPMGTQYKKDAGNFASTGGWTLAHGNAMDYLNRYDLIPLSANQQKQVGDIAKNIYRPCCNNATWFPDCNHGMAALAIIELMVNSHVDERLIYKKVLGFNSFWFPDSYISTATYFARRGTPWKDVDPKQILGATYSTATGASKISNIVGPLPYANPVGGSCGA